MRNRQTCILPHICLHIYCLYRFYLFIFFYFYLFIYLFIYKPQTNRHLHLVLFSAWKIHLCPLVNIIYLFPSLLLFLNVFFFLSLCPVMSSMLSQKTMIIPFFHFITGQIKKITLRNIVVVLLFYVHGKHLRSCLDGQLT